MITLYMCVRLRGHAPDAASGHFKELIGDNSRPEASTRAFLDSSIQQQGVPRYWAIHQTTCAAGSRLQDEVTQFLLGTMTTEVGGSYGRV